MNTNKLCYVFLMMLAALMPMSVKSEERNNNSDILMEKRNIGNLLALYPTPVTVVGAEVNGKVNWLVVSHVGIIGHDRILVSMSKQHYTNQGIKESGRLSLNLVSREMLPQADYVGSVSGDKIDKSEVFAYHYGENGTPVIDESPLSMELDVVDVYDSPGFDNFICTIANTYADRAVLDENGKPDYNKLRPVLFEFPTYSYLAAGPVLGKCRQFEKQPHNCHKEVMQPDGIIRLSRVEVYPEYIDEYMEFATEVGEISLMNEPGVLTMYAMQQKDNPCIITILERYSSEEAYRKHIASDHFQKYKQGTLHMVKNLDLVDQKAINPANVIENHVIL